MSESITLTCDQCGDEAEEPVYGWLRLRASKGSTVVSVPEAKGDYCGVACMVKFLGRLQVQSTLFDGPPSGVTVTRSRKTPIAEEADAKTGRRRQAKVAAEA